jgi:hypothetical protein
MENPTPQGASIHDRIMSVIDSAPSEDPTNDPIVEDEQSIQNEPEPEVIQDEEPEETGEPQGDEPEGEAEESEGIKDDGESEQETLSLTDLSQFLGIDEADLDLDDEGNVLIKTKVDGQEGKAKLQDLKTSYQLRAHLDNQNREAAELKKSLQETTANAEKQAAERLEHLDSMLQLAWSELEQQAGSPELEALREDDPAEWTAKQREIEQRQQRLAKTYQQLQAEKQQNLVGQQAKIHEHLANEDQKLMNAIDGWSDMDKAQKEIKDIYSYLSKDYGYSTEDLYGVKDSQGNYVTLGVSDHRLVVMARKAMLYDQLQQSKPTVSNKVKKAPRIVKPGQPKSKQESSQAKIRDLKKAVKQSGGKGKSVADYLIATGKV